MASLSHVKHLEHLQRFDPQEVYNQTPGSWANEDESVAAFESILNEIQCFEYYREFTTFKLFDLPHWRTPVKKLRPDFLLVPRPRLIAAGWPEDQAVIVECKRSGTAIGPALSQLLDYIRCEFTLPGGLVVRPTWGLLWPAIKQHRALASLMAHQHIGTISTDRLDGHSSPFRRMRFFCGESRLATFEPDRVQVLERSFRIGRRSGSR